MRLRTATTNSAASRCPTPGRCARGRIRRGALKRHAALEYGGHDRGGRRFSGREHAFFAGAAQSRDAARRNDCANNMRQMGGLLVCYSDQHRHFFPFVAANENAGIYTVRLVDADTIGADELARLLVCRSSPLADQIAAGRVVVRIPTMERLRRATAGELASLRDSMGGSYAYRIGYIDGNVYVGIRDDRSPNSPILADAPSFELAGLKTINHGGCGQNVLYQDQSVRYQQSCTLPGLNDHLFLNAAGQPAAGRGPFDVVLGSSPTTPGVVPSETEP